ncbi:hypothetical protein GCK72_009573 [Caenorhabditis remanei]|uniref:Uncharacterized protein n=1 Tax=Caenorhabditis remanei TaxID=31234 RepID=A0A6A5H245_CAERE|nr:hypothetical protein GCK72_009573 [Caenorhabditis remanei]KAF1761317.1 hypothetical protein GCK72_009573 [Caenorhabditis remanei]
MDNQHEIDMKVKDETDAVARKMRAIESNKKSLWICNFGVEFGLALYHVLLLLTVPKHYPYFRNQFYLTIFLAFLNIIATIKMKISLQVVQAILSIIQLLWIFYCFATVPIFLTAITSTPSACDRVIHSCAKVFNANLFQTKMTIGLMSQAIFAIFLYGEMKRLCIILKFRYMAPKSTHYQTQVTENIKPESPSANELPEKNPNEIVIVA